VAHAAQRLAATRPPLVIEDLLAAMQNLPING
jgi:hypothetical protein